MNWRYFSPESLAYFEPNSPQSLARQIVGVVHDLKLRESLAKNARKEYGPISWNVMKERYLELVARLCGEESPASSPIPTQTVGEPVPTTH